MSILLFNGAVSQYIDNNGKCRMLTYEGELSLMVSPLPPLNLKEDKNIKVVTLRTAQQFIKERNLEIEFQDGNKNDGIKGLWIITKDENSIIYYGYIPVINSPYIKEIEFMHPMNNDPLRTDSTSDLNTLRTTRKVAEFLKQYTLLTFSLDPKKFGKNSFIVIKDYDYDIEKLNKKLFKDNNKIMYKDNKLIVPSKNIRDRLINYLNTQLLNDSLSVENIKNIKSIDSYYQNISDFQHYDNQLIFLNKSGLLRWKQSLKNDKSLSVSSLLDFNTKEPYYYKNPRIKNDTLMIIQNVKDGNIDRAISLSYKWSNEQINTGYNTPILSSHSNISYVIYTIDGENHKFETEEHDNNNDNFGCSILKYSNNMYASLLFLSREI